MEVDQIAALTALAGGNVDESIAAPKGCQTAEEHERQFTATATALDKIVAKLAKRRQLDAGAIAKLVAEATKARRSASALAADRERDVRAERLVRHEAEMMRMRGSH